MFNTENENQVHTEHVYLKKTWQSLLFFYWYLEIGTSMQSIYNRDKF